MLKVPTTESLEKECKKLWPQAVYLVNGKQCAWNEIERTKKHRGIIHPHHVVLKSRCKHLAYTVVNGIPLCEACHGYVHNSCRAHRASGMSEFSLWYSDKYPDRWKYLQESRYQIVKVAENIEQWRDELKRIVEDPQWVFNEC